MGKILLTIWILLLCSSCLDNVRTNPQRDDLPATLQLLLQEAIDDSFESVPGISMAVIAPDLQLEWQGAAGFDSKKREQKLRTEQPFRIASVTKTFVAAALLRLSEDGHLSINDPISHLISTTHDSLLRSGGYNPDSITWQTILNHTSGLFDYALGGPTYIQRVKQDPTHRWTRTEQIALAMETGKPRVAGSYHYSDTGYILAGEAIEIALDTTLAAGLRQLIKFQTLQLYTSWLESLEPAPKDHLDVVHRYFRKEDVTEWDASIDLYGGGGLMSNCKDLAVFMHSLFNNGIFQDPNTLIKMLSPAIIADEYDKENDHQYKDYRLGLWRAEVFGMDTYLHGGIWGTGIIHVPDLNLSIAVNCTDGRWERVVKKTILTIKNLQTS